MTRRKRKRAKIINKTGSDVKAKAATVDLQTLSTPNLNVSTHLSEDFKDSKLIDTKIYPPDISELFDNSKKVPDDEYDKQFWIAVDKVKRRFPLMQLRKKTETNMTIFAFTDPFYESNTPTEGILSVPTWMDPEVFVRMAIKNAEVMAAIKSAVKHNSLRTVPNIAALLQKVFDEEYLPYLMSKFDTVKALLSRWMIAREVCNDPKQADYKPAPEIKPTIKPAKKPI